MELTEFLLARIAEDEAAVPAIRDPEPVPRGCWDEDRVLAECEAKRQIVERHESGPVVDHWEDECTCGFENHRLSRCMGCGAVTFDEGDWQRPFGPCPELRLLAAVYAAHPDYRPEWNPAVTSGR